MMVYDQYLGIPDLLMVAVSCDLRADDCSGLAYGYISKNNQYGVCGTLGVIYNCYLCYEISSRIKGRKLGPSIW